MLRKKKDISRGSRVDLDEEDGSLYMKFEDEYPSLSKFIENNHSFLLGSNPNPEFAGTIVREEENKEKPQRRDEVIENKDILEVKREKLSYSKFMGDEGRFDKIDSGSFRRSLEDKTCYTCKRGECIIQ